MPPKKPPRKTKYQKDWENKKDEDGTTFGLWLSRGKTEHHAHCNLCKKDFAIVGSGFSKVTTHAKGAEHKKIYKDTYDAQTKIQTGEYSSVFTLSRRDEVCKAELIWLFNIIRSDLAFAVSDGMSDVFVAMLPDSELVKSFAMGRCKVG